MKKEDIDNLRKFYANNLLSYFSKYENEINSKLFDQSFLKLFIKYFDKNEKILDIGCGSTCQSARFLADYLSVEAIDVVPECIELARNKFPHLKLNVMDFTNLKYQDLTFSGIVGYYCIGHIPSLDRVTTFLELNRVLNKKGKLALVVHEGTNDAYSVDGTYFKSFCIEEICSELQRANFTILSKDSRDPLYSDEGKLRRIYLIAEKL